MYNNDVYFLHTYSPVVNDRHGTLGGLNIDLSKVVVLV